MTSLHTLWGISGPSTSANIFSEWFLTDQWERHEMGWPVWQSIWFRSRADSFTSGAA